jgi:hypothetical protein
VTTGSVLAPSAATATLFNVKHYLMLMTVLDPDTGAQRNAMATWNEKEWVITSQTVNLTYIGTQKIESKFFAWGTDGNTLYPMFRRPSNTLVKRLDTKQYGGNNPLMINDFRGIWISGQDRSVTQEGIVFQSAFNLSGIAIQENVAAPDLDTTSVPSIMTSGNIPGANLLIHGLGFAAPPPSWPVMASGTGGAPFINIQARLTTASPDFVLSHLVLGYTETQAFFGS